MFRTPKRVPDTCHSLTISFFFFFLFFCVCVCVNIKMSTKSVLCTRVKYKTVLRIKSRHQLFFMLYSFLHRVDRRNIK